VTAEAEPAAAVGVCYARGVLELACGRNRDALAAFRAAEQLAGRLDAPNLVNPRVRALQLFSLACLGDTERAGQVLAGLDERDRDRWDVHVATAALRLAQGDPSAATAALAPVLNGSARLVWPFWLQPRGGSAGGAEREQGDLRAGQDAVLVQHAYVLEAIARDALGDQDAAGRALERALDLAEPGGWLLPFLLHPAKGLLERQARHRTAHAALIAEILGLLAGNRSAPRPAGPWPPVEPLSGSELRVLRYLPTNLTVPEIAGELYVSVNTVKTHVGNLYAKLGAHRRAEAVARARDLGLLAPSAHAKRILASLPQTPVD
jgi:LuxR family transcriptional regulator, maltose regulon positive regulatory protein